MFYNNQVPYSETPYNSQNQEQSYLEQQFENQEIEPQQESQYQPNPYLTQQSQDPQHQHNPYLTQQSQETQHQHNPYVAQQFQETPYLSQQFPYQQPQMYQPNQTRVSQPGPGPQAVPTEPSQQQIQQAVGTKYLALKKPVLDFVNPWVEYGMNEAKYTSHQHAMTEIAAIMFLVGSGFDPTIAHYIVESWEKNEQF
ncbi:hypothetical protein [Bacillus sp. C1]